MTPDQNLLNFETPLNCYTPTVALDNLSTSSCGAGADLAEPSWTPICRLIAKVPWSRPQDPAHGCSLTLSAGSQGLHVPQGGFACQSILKSVVISARVDFYEDRRDTLLLLHHPSRHSAAGGVGRPQQSCPIA